MDRFEGKNIYFLVFFFVRKYFHKLQQPQVKVVFSFETFAFL